MRLKCAPSAQSTLEIFSDQTFPDENDLWSDRNLTILLMIGQPCPRQNLDHCQDNFKLKIASDQTIVRSKPTPDHTIVRSNSSQIRTN